MIQKLPPENTVDDTGVNFNPWKNARKRCHPHVVNTDGCSTNNNHLAFQFTLRHLSVKNVCHRNMPEGLGIATIIDHDTT